MVYIMYYVVSSVLYVAAYIVAMSYFMQIQWVLGWVSNGMKEAFTRQLIAYLSDLTRGLSCQLGDLSMHLANSPTRT